MPITTPWSPIQRYHGCGDAASTASRTDTAGGSTASRYSCGWRADSSLGGRLPTRPGGPPPGHRPQGGELLDRLMRGSVLTEADRVVGEDVDHGQIGQRGEADRRPHVV